MRQIWALPALTQDQLNFRCYRRALLPLSRYWINFPIRSYIHCTWTPHLDLVNGVWWRFYGIFCKDHHWAPFSYQALQWTENHTFLCIPTSFFSRGIASTKAALKWVTAVVSFLRTAAIIKTVDADYLQPLSIDGIGIREVLSYKW